MQEKNLNYKSAVCFFATNEHELLTNQTRILNNGQFYFIKMARIREAKKERNKSCRPYPALIRPLSKVNFYPIKSMGQIQVLKEVYSFYSRQMTGFHRTQL
ncbi:MAG: hypothetical protein BWK80_17440 [Desulfobacteraceae bacterium IS3]|nr:MAG: hypothetical protein BWK80_17440 [Desulfobacteraceae bacterium IS3]